MSNSTASVRKTSAPKIQIAPHEICDSCGSNSGPKFFLADLKGPSVFHRHNIIPYGSQRTSTLSDIDHAGSQILQLDKEIDRLTKVIKSLKNRSNALKVFNIQQKSLFAPIRRLPEEVLQHIFLVGRDVSEHDGFITVSYAKGFVQTVTQVCAYWRSVAFSFPRLWSRIDLGYQRQKKLSAGYEPFFERFITLSCEVPLYLKIYGSPKFLGDRFIKAVANSVHRWKEVKVDNYKKTIQAISAQNSSDVVYSRLTSLWISDSTGDVSLRSTPVLTHLIVENEEDPREFMTKFTISLNSAPSLFHLSIKGLYHPQTTFIEFPWSQITHFKCDDCEFGQDELSAILKSMTNLISFTLYGMTGISRCIVVPQLHILNLEDHYKWRDEISMDVLNVISAPNLKELHCLDLEFSSPAILQFLKRSYSLENLTLTKAQLGEGWKSVQLPNLKKLCLDRPKLIAKDLRCLTRDADSNILPALETLYLESIPFGAKTAVVNIIPMVKSRLRPIQQPTTSTPIDESISYLKSVTLKFERDLENWEKRTLNEFIYSKTVRQSGVVINITYGQFQNDTDSSTDPDMYCDDDILVERLEQILQRND
ncbi:hypothetical protein BDQ17DRAFT_1285244 [Cyathus striatus]|nr:hypothetical protein BDQ17DRAFT_1285244 [Cyathus striatus]